MFQLMEHNKKLSKMRDTNEGFNVLQKNRADKIVPRLRSMHSYDILDQPDFELFKRIQEQIERSGGKPTEDNDKKEEREEKITISYEKDNVELVPLDEEQKEQKVESNRQPEFNT